MGGTPKSLKTPNTKEITNSNPVGVPNTNGSEGPISTPTPVAKSRDKNKKRKINQEEQVDELIQRAGIEALAHGDMDP